MTIELMWLDLETTGLDPAQNRILEVAASIATLDDPFTVCRRYHAVLRYTDLDTLGLDPYVRDMHTKNGLLTECAKSTTAMDEAEQGLLDLITPVENKDERPVLAGSSIHFDRAFIKRWMPTLFQRLSHRLYDASAVKLFCRSVGMSNPPKAEAHRAMDDISESIAHTKACKDWLKENARNFK